MKNNCLFYMTADNEGLFRYHDGASNTYQNLAWFEGASGISSIATGNVASGNVVVEPGMAGGTGATLLVDAPTGFDASWYPNTVAFSLPGASPASVNDGGLDLGVDYDEDIRGVARVAWSMGAYEYVAATPYTVFYSSNGSTSGTPPADGATYAALDPVTLLGNTGTLAKTYYVWRGWNTAADGSGTRYFAGAVVAMPAADLTLYAEWVPLCALIRT